jgi:hypothetical protein
MYRRWCRGQSTDLRDLISVALLTKAIWQNGRPDTIWPEIRARGMHDGFGLVMADRSDLSSVAHYLLYDRR